MRYSFASNGELKSAYYAAEARKYIDSAEAAELIALNESIARMLRRWQATLDVSDKERDRNGHGPKDEKRAKDPGRTKDQGRTKA